MRKKIKQYLLNFKRMTITIDELEQFTPKTQSYETFATLINQLEQENILQMIKASGRNSRTPSIAFRYKINKYKLNRSYHEQLQLFRLKFHDAINLDAYFSLDSSVWQSDLPYLEKVNTYLESHNFPTKKVPAPERSFELVGDEKWIEEKGSELLHRIQLWDVMKIYPVSDPLMFAINPEMISNKDHLHLIVENKTTYDGLLPVLVRSDFSTLIYGSGNKISKSIENFPNQYPVSGNHTFFYFGDIDRSGITIWHSLHKRKQSVPAFPFYESCLQKVEAFGKTNQRPNEKALKTFLTFFPEKSQAKISETLSNGAYYPQEVLSTEELQHIWCEADWHSLVNLNKNKTK